MMEFTAEMIAGFLGGQVAGDKEAKVHTVSSIEEGEPGALTYLTNPKYEKHLYKTRASIVLVNKDFTGKAESDHDDTAEASGKRRSVGERSGTDRYESDGRSQRIRSERVHQGAECLPGIY